jgi:hypothetical protein
MALIDMSNHFRQWRGTRSQGRWTWRMRRGRWWVSSQCDYVLGGATNLGQWIPRISVRTPFCHDSDHRAIVAEICTGGGREMAKYRKRYRCFPLKIPRGPRAELVSKYEELHLDVIPPPMRERPANRWILDKTWAAVDKRATIHRKGHLTTYYARGWGARLNHYSPRIANNAPQTPPPPSKAISATVP